MGNIGHNLKVYFKFNAREKKELIITIVVAAFILSFRKWGEGNTVNIAAGFGNLLLGLIFVGIGIFLHVAAQKFAAIRLGYVVKYHYWKFGMFAGAIITFLTSGLWPVFFTGTVDGNVEHKLRVGSYRPRFKQWEYAVANAAGPAVNVILILLAKPFFTATGAEFFKFFIFCNLFILIYSMFPLPFFHGVKAIEGGMTGYDFKGGTIGFNLVLGANRLAFAALFFLVLSYALLAMMVDVFSIWLSILVAILMFIVFYFAFEK